MRKKGGRCCGLLPFGYELEENLITLFAAYAANTLGPRQRGMR